MATLVLTAVGTALGGPLGGALGALAGRSVDQAIIGTPSREGPRLKDLSVTMSSYGQPLSRIFGTVRTAGTIIWATDLVERKESTGGSKGQPGVTSYSYSVSLAIALSSAPVEAVGRIWADGNLLRGSAGDLKVGGGMRLYRGYGDQPLDPLIASDRGSGRTPAFRNIAYVVFEDLDLSEFGNRIPALTFEVIERGGDIRLIDMIGGASAEVSVKLPGLSGFSHEAGSYAALLEELSTAYPLACDTRNETLALVDATPDGSRTPVVLPPTAMGADDDFGRRTGISRQRAAKSDRTQIALRYYDKDRDYQPGLQRSGGRAVVQGPQTIEFPATMRANDARRLADRIAARSDARRETMAYRIATIHPDIRPGAHVIVPGERGLWQVLSWEWRESGIELELEALRTVGQIGNMPTGATGQGNPPVDRIGGSTSLAVFELPWDGVGASDVPTGYAATSSDAVGWTGAALYKKTGVGALAYVRPALRSRAVIGTLTTRLRAASPHIVDRHGGVVIELLPSDQALVDCDMASLANGANRARIGSEIVQFAKATALGDGRWRIEQLLRGRGGTEAEIADHEPGTQFVLLDERLTPLPPSAIDNPVPDAIVALGNSDPEPVVAPFENAGLSLRPLVPVHGRAETFADGSILVNWVRRARGGWQWLNQVETPLNEASEAYEISARTAEGETLFWEAKTSSLLISPLDAERLAPLRTIEIRQRGRVSLSLPLVLALPAVL